MASATAGKLLRELSDEGVIIRTRNSVHFVYTAAPDADIPDIILPCMILRSDPARIMVAEQKAKALADKGLWHRAAGVYTDMFSIVCSSVEVARIAKRRNECLRMARRP
ncbi:PerC family transcriptional regulator [Leclercia pneumoniae]|uniref:PerC family transcriptional regulator n=1 Tax=Leclercia pneumoniae TaxID=2815358 RepID=UPI003AF56A16